MDKEVNARIRKYRKSQNMTQKDLGKALGIKCSTYSQMERNGKITVEMAARIAKVLDVDPDIMMLGEKEKPSPFEPVITPPIKLGTPDPFTPPSEPEVIVGIKCGEITLSIEEERIIHFFRNLSPEKKKEVTNYLTNLNNKL